MLFWLSWHLLGITGADPILRTVRKVSLKTDPARMVICQLVKVQGEQGMEKKETEAREKRRQEGSHACLCLFTIVFFFAF